MGIYYERQLSFICRMQIKTNLLLLTAFLCLLLSGCNEDNDPQPEAIIINGLEYGVDFVEQLVYNSEFRVYSETNLSNDNITIKNFKLPKNTLFWSYWFVVKQGEQDPFAYAVRELSGEAAKYTSDPLTALGLGLISSLPFLQENTETLDLYLTDYDNALLANEGKAFNVYNFGSEQNVISISKNIQDIPLEEIYVVASNDNFTKGLDAYLRVVAFVEK